jgi:DNA repair protein RecN (Recombination protein N)
MLTKLIVENIALLRKAEVTFESGMSVLTGETGAGKSVIVTALSLALGGRADREQIRHGADKAGVAAFFDVSKASTAFKRTHAQLIDNDAIHIVRTISRKGSGKIKINNRQSTLAELKALASPLAEILGQHAAQALMDEDNHLDFLDAFGDLTALREEVANAFRAWRSVADELARTIRRREQLIQERELLLFQQNEIESANITVGEEESLLTERKLLDSALELMQSADGIVHLLDDDNGTLSSLSSARKELEKMAAVDAALEKKVEEFSDAVFRLEDLRSFIEQYGASVPNDPRRLEEVNLRLDEIYKLKKKYGGSEETILKSLIDMNDRLKDRPDIDRLITELEKDCLRQFEDYSALALKLSDTRHKSAAYLKKLVEKELTELAIDNGGFEFEFIYEDDPNGVVLNDRVVKPGEQGLEQGRILFSANPGEPLKSLVRTASGGEMSRVLLALKAASQKASNINRSLLVFDEVDAGIGGQTAAEVGRKLKQLSKTSQLLVITHLHQIARLADHHYVAEKSARSGGRATIAVKQLDDANVSSELNRMVALPEGA